MALRASLLALAIASTASAASAQVTAVVTETTATILTLAVQEQFTGTDIMGAGDNDFGDGGSFHSTSQIEPGFIQFRNGNSSAGLFAQLFSRTIVDITFRNDGDTAVTPELHSTITPEGMGFFVAPRSGCTPDTNGCAPDSPDIASDFQDFVCSTTEPCNTLGGGSFLFRITGNGQTIFELDGSVALLRDETTGVNSISADVAEAAAVLSGFRLNSPAGSDTEFGFAWDATEIFVPFPVGTLLQPGESATLRYETITETFANVAITSEQDVLLAYSSFGDPVGRRGGATRTPFAEGGLTYDLFRFNAPTYRDGVLSYTLDGFIAPVPEPASWAMMIAGFGLVGGAMRRVRGGAACGKLMYGRV